MTRVAGKVSLISGGAMGLGLAEAEALAAEGAQVVIADVDEHAGREAVRQIGASAVFLWLDVRDEDNWREVVSTTVALFGGLNVLVNNAGVLEMADVEQCTLDSWRRISSVSVEGSFLGIKHALPAMRRSGSGSIINTSSSAALQGVPPWRLGRWIELGRGHSTAAGGRAAGHRGAEPAELTRRLRRGDAPRHRAAGWADSFGRSLMGGHRRE